MVHNTDERKEKVDFSEPFHLSGTVLVVRKDSKKDEITIKILDGNNEEKNNVADILKNFQKEKQIHHAFSQKNIMKLLL